MPSFDGPLDFVLKIASRCNLNCTYCYVYNKGDDSWRDRPGLMPQRVFEAAVERIAAHVELSGQPRVQVTFHGGEPTLVGRDRFDSWCAHLRARLSPLVELDLQIQSNAVLIDRRWAELFRRHGVTVGVSVDGPASVHDSARIDHKGRGSHARVVEGLARLAEAGIPIQLLCVIDPGADSIAIHDHLTGLGATWINYLLPDYTHDEIAQVRRRFGPTPCADYMLPLLDHWMMRGAGPEQVGLFWNMSQLVLGGPARTDLFGGRPLSFVFIETDGAIETLDVLRSCEPGMPGLALHVLHNAIAEIGELSSLQARSILHGFETPTACRACPEVSTCGGGYAPHRHARESGFDNPTVWCEDLKILFARLRPWLDVDLEETVLRRRVLEEMRQEAFA